MRVGDRQIEEEWLAGRFLALNVIGAAFCQFPIDAAPHLDRLGLGVDPMGHRLERMAHILDLADSA